MTKMKRNKSDIRIIKGDSQGRENDQRKTKRQFLKAEGRKEKKRNEDRMKRKEK